MKDRIENFQLKERIRPGGQSIVYKAIEDRQGVTRDAAIKVLKDFDPSSAEDQAAFREEVQILSDLSNVPSVVTIYQFGIDDEVGAWIAMELLGESLADSVNDGPGDPAKLPAILRDVLSALQAMHNAQPRILQRDLKPANILLSRSGTYKIADFGCASRTDSTATMSKMTVRYAAPETLDGTLGKVGPAADLYSLGMTIYEWALGHTLFRQQFPSIFDVESGEQTTAFHDDARRWMYWHCSPTQTAPTLAQIIPGFPPALSDLIARMMTKNPAERLGDAGEALRLLETAVSAAGGPAAGAAAAPRPVPQVRSSAPPAPKPTSSSGSKIAVLSFVGIFLLAAVAILFMLMRPRGPEPAIGVRPEGYQAAERFITVDGQVSNAPPGAQLKMKVLEGFRDLTLDDDGGFTTTVDLADIGAVEATLYLGDEDGEVLETKSVRVERLPPPAIEITFRTRPAVAGAVVKFIDPATEEILEERTTDAGGEATAPIRHGRFHLSVEHPEYETLSERNLDTGTQAEKTLTATLLSNVEPVEFIIRPANASVQIQREGEARPRSVELDENGTTTIRLPFGNYMVRASAEGFRSADQLVEVRRDRLPVVSMGLIAADVPIDIFTLDPREVDEREVLRLNGEEFERFLRGSIPLRQIEIEKVVGMNRLRVKGSVYDQQELKALEARLKPSEKRITKELTINENAVEQAIKEALEAQGAGAVRAQSLTLNNERRIHVFFRPTADCTAEYGTEIALSFVINPNLLAVKPQ